MRIAPRIGLLAMAAVAILSLTAPPALAELDLTDEASGELCPEVDVDSPTAAGGCPLLLTGTFSAATHVFGVEVALSACDVDFEARVDESGSGAAYDQVLSGGSCTVEPCDDDEPWPIQFDEPAPSTQHLLVQMCLDTSITEIGCTFEADLTVTDHDTVEAEADDATCEEGGLALELDATWVTDTNTEHPAVEFVEEAALPDPVLFVHGIRSSPRVWTTMMNRLVADGWPAARLQAIGYNWHQSNADTSVLVGATIEQMLMTHNVAKVDVVTHSMGGLSSRHHLKTGMAAQETVDAWVSIAGPNHGTDRARLCPRITSCGEMVPGSGFLTALNATDETPGAVRYRTWRTPCDFWVRPLVSPELTGAVNTVTANCPSHSGIRDDLTVYGQVRDFIAGP